MARVFSNVTLQSGADDLVKSDSSADGALLLALQTRQQLAATALSMTGSSDKMVCVSDLRDRSKRSYVRSGVKNRPQPATNGMSARPPILLQKSKIERCPKSRES
jgi:hypothetical protein